MKKEMWLFLVMALLLIMACSNTDKLDSLDTDPPLTVITYPGNSELLSSRQFTVRVIATDNAVIEKVNLYLNGILVSTLTASPFEFTATVDSATNQVTILAEMVDKNGNQGMSQLITVYFPDLTDDISPTVNILSPAAWSEIYGDTLEVNIQAADNQGIEQIICYFNGDSVYSLRNEPYRWKHNIRSYSGNATFFVEARDWSGNVGFSAPVSVSLNLPDVSPPEVQIVHPADWQTVTGVFLVRLAVNDNVGVREVEIWWDGSVIDTLTTAPFELSINSTLYPNGNYTLMARARDVSGNVNDSRVINVVVNN